MAFDVARWEVDALRYRTVQYRNDG